MFHWLVFALTAGTVQGIPVTSALEDAPSKRGAKPQKISRCSRGFTDVAVEASILVGLGTGDTGPASAKHPPNRVCSRQS